MVAVGLAHGKRIRALLTSQSFDEATENEQDLFDVHQVLCFQPASKSVHVLGEL